MADFTVTLGAVSGDKQSPFRYIQTKNQIGTAGAVITAGKYLDVEMHYTLCYAQIVLVTSADVGNRKVAVDVGNWNKYKTANVAASSTVYIHMRQETEVTNLVRDVQDDYSLALHDLSFLFYGDDAFYIAIENGFAADVWNAKLTFKYRNNDFGIALPEVASYTPQPETKKCWLF